MELSEQARSAAPVSTDETENPKHAAGEAHKGKSKMRHNIGISGIRVKSNSLLLALFLLLVWCVQIVPGLGNAYAQYVYPAIARVLSSFSRLIPFAIGDLFIALSIAGLLLYPVYARHIRKQRWKSILLADAKYLLWVYVSVSYTHLTLPTNREV